MRDAMTMTTRNTFKGRPMEKTAALYALPQTIGAIEAEVVAARSKHPAADFAALVEECGEVGKILTDLRAARIAGLAGGGAFDRDRLERELIQIAAVAIRLIEEGEPVYGVEPLDVFVSTREGA
jgi:hypothetical protein